MTPHPVICFEHNGEPYGRYKNPNPKRISRKPYEPILKYEKILLDYKEFEKFAEANIFPFPSGIIGKTYQRDEVEKIQQTFDLILKKWFDTDMQSREMQYKTRQIFRLIPQPVEKEPETVEDLTLIKINQLIGEIRPCKPNFDHIADNGKINGTLLADIRSAMWKLLEWQKKQNE